MTISRNYQYQHRTDIETLFIEILMPVICVFYFFFSFTNLFQTISKGLCLICLLFPLIYYVIFHAGSLKASPIVLLSAFILVLLSFFNSIFGTGGWEQLVNLLFLFSLYFFFTRRRETISKSFFVFDSFCYWAIVAGLVFYMFNHFFFGGDLNIVSQTNINYSSFVVFSFFCYCLSEKRFMGLVISLIYGVYTGSRAFIFCACFVAFFYIIHFIRKKNKPSSNDNAVFISPQLFFTFGVFLLFLTFIVSYFWIFFLASKGVVDYHSGLNDGSNASRFASNLYAFEKILSDPSLLVFGHAGDIFAYLGITSDYLHTAFAFGFRVVQPHNSYLNLILSYGLLFSVFYFFFLSSLFSSITNRNNWPVIICVFIYAFVMHSLFDSMYLVWVSSLLFWSSCKRQDSFRKGVFGWLF